jgi:AmiR/NasT family two-component response regulator
MENNKNFVKEAKLIFNMGVGRALLKAGCQVIDCKPDKSNPDKTVLVFKNDEVFQRELARINKEIAETKAAEEVL